MIDDGLITATLLEQEELEARILQLYRDFGDFGGLDADDPDLILTRKQHAKYLAGGLGELPPGFISLDASRAWICYWVTHALALLGKPLPAWLLKAAVVDFLASCQHPEGGFGGGPYQLPHLAPTYAGEARWLRCLEWVSLQPGAAYSRETGFGVWWLLPGVWFLEKRAGSAVYGNARAATLAAHSSAQRNCTAASHSTHAAHPALPRPPCHRPTAYRCRCCHACRRCCSLPAAAVAALVTLGGEEALELVDRQKLWRYLLSMCVSPSEGGGMTMHQGGVGHQGSKWPGFGRPWGLSGRHHPRLSGTTFVEAGWHLGFGQSHPTKPASNLLRLPSPDALLSILKHCSTFLFILSSTYAHLPGVCPTDRVTDRSPTQCSASPALWLQAARWTCAGATAPWPPLTCSTWTSRHWQRHVGWWSMCAPARWGTIHACGQVEALAACPAGLWLSGASASQALLLGPLLLGPLLLRPLPSYPSTVGLRCVGDCTPCRP